MNKEWRTKIEIIPLQEGVWKDQGNEKRDNNHICNKKFYNMGKKLHLKFEEVY